MRDGFLIDMGTIAKAVTICHSFGPVQVPGQEIRILIIHRLYERIMNLSQKSPGIDILPSGCSPIRMLLLQLYSRKNLSRHIRQRLIIHDLPFFRHLLHPHRHHIQVLFFHHPQSLRHSGRDLIVTIDKSDALTLHLSKPRIPRRPQIPVDQMTDNPHIIMLPGIFFQQCQRLVRGSIVHRNHLKLILRHPQRIYTVQTPIKCLGNVIAGDDE